MKVYIFSHWYDYEGSSVLAVYSDLDKAKDRLQYEYNKALEEHTENQKLASEAGWGSCDINPPIINLEDNTMSYYGNNYSFEEYNLDEE